MTKAALKRRNARLIEKRDQMNTLIDNTEQEIKEMDSRESRELLEKFHIESEELAKLILLRNSENKEGDMEEPAMNRRGRRAKVEAATETGAEPERPWSKEEPAGEQEEEGQETEEYEMEPERPWKDEESEEDLEPAEDSYSEEEANPEESSYPAESSAPEEALAPELQSEYDPLNISKFKEEA